MPVALMNVVDDLLASPPSAGAYHQFKAALLRRTTEPEPTHLRRVVNFERLGNARPTQMVTRMQQFLVDSYPRLQDNILRELVLQYLSLNMRMILAYASNITLDELAEMADRAAEYAAPIVFSLAPMAQRTPVSNIEK